MKVSTFGSRLSIVGAAMFSVLSAHCLGDEVPCAFGPGQCGTGGAGAAGAASTTGGGGSGGAMGGAGGTGAQGGAGATGGVGGAPVGGGGTGGVVVDLCGPDDVDDDGDGFTENDGDCNDCDSLVNPMAAELVEGSDNGIDNDCDGFVDTEDPDLKPCDDGLLMESNVPMDGVRAIGLCDKKADGTPKHVTKASYVLADGFKPGPAVDMEKFHRGHGILGHLGLSNLPREGQHMLALSSGTARNTSEAGFVSRNFNKGYSSNPPYTFTGTTPGCPGVVVPKSSVQDSIGLEIEITAPVNAAAFEFASQYFTYDWPQAMCTQLADTYWVNLLIGDVEKNVLYDAGGGTIGAQSGFIAQCACPMGNPGICLAPPNPAPGQPQKETSCGGSDGLVGTDFDGNTNPAALAGWTNGASGWLRTRVPIVPGAALKVRFTVFDSGVSSNGTKDHNSDSTALIDRFRWSDEIIPVAITQPE